MSFSSACNAQRSDLGIRTTTNLQKYDYTIFLVSSNPDDIVTRPPFIMLTATSKRSGHHAVRLPHIICHKLLCFYIVLTPPSFQLQDTASYLASGKLGHASNTQEKQRKSARFHARLRETFSDSRRSVRRQQRRTRQVQTSLPLFHHSVEHPLPAGAPTSRTITTPVITNARSKELRSRLCVPTSACLRLIPRTRLPSTRCFKFHSKLRCTR